MPEKRGVSVTEVPANLSPFLFLDLRLGVFVWEVEVVVAPVVYCDAATIFSLGEDNGTDQSFPDIGISLFGFYPGPEFGLLDGIRVDELFGPISAFPPAAIGCTPCSI